jgi:hypothetical protein
LIFIILFADLNGIDFAKRRKGSRGKEKAHEIEP